MQINAPAFGGEIPLVAERAAERRHAVVAGAFIAYQHARIDTFADESVHQSRSRNGCSAVGVVCAYQKDFHLFK
jgi:hypothetical protein